MGDSGTCCRWDCLRWEYGDWRHRLDHGKGQKVVNILDTVLSTTATVNGETIADDTIDDDSIDFSDVTGADITLTDCGAVKASSYGDVSVPASATSATNGQAVTLSGYVNLLAGTGGAVSGTNTITLAVGTAGQQRALAAGCSCQQLPSASGSLLCQSRHHDLQGQQEPNL